MYVPTYQCSDILIYSLGIGIAEDRNSGDRDRCHSHQFVSWQQEEKNDFLVRVCVFGATIFFFCCLSNNSRLGWMMKKCKFFNTSVLAKVKRYLSRTWLYNVARIDNHSRGKSIEVVVVCANAAVDNISSLHTLKTARNCFVKQNIPRASLLVVISPAQSFVMRARRFLYALFILPFVFVRWAQKADLYSAQPRGIPNIRVQNNRNFKNDPERNEPPIFIDKKTINWEWVKLEMACITFAFLYVTLKSLAMQFQVIFF